MDREPTAMTTADDELLALARNAFRNGKKSLDDFKAAAVPSAIIALIERHLAEVERLTRERDEARNAADYAEALTARTINERESAEAALAAAQKRIGELKESLEHAISIIEKHVPRDALGTNSQGAGDGWNDQSWPILDEYLHYMRAALAGGTAGDGEQMAQHQREPGT